MNTRILQLADIAFINHLKENPLSGCVIRSDYINDFTELIVKETMQVVANNLPQNVYLDVVEAVIAHFEIKKYSNN